jgi:hypothetical protein
LGVVEISFLKETGSITLMFVAVWALHERIANNRKAENVGADDFIYRFNKINKLKYLFFNFNRSVIVIN